MSTIEREVSTEAIARRAYELWQERGCPPGDGVADWQAAEVELRNGNSNGHGQSADERGLLGWLRRLRHRAH